MGWGRQRGRKVNIQAGPVGGTNVEAEHGDYLEGVMLTMGITPSRGVLGWQLRRGCLTWNRGEGGEQKEGGPSGGEAVTATWVLAGVASFFTRAQKSALHMTKTSQVPCYPHAIKFLHKYCKVKCM